MKVEKYTNNKGLMGEFVASALLVCKGFEIIERRYKTACGEIDIIAGKGDLIIFVEVKWRQNTEKCFQAITNRQLLRVQRASEIFISNHPEYEKNFRRYDVILVTKWNVPLHIENVSLDCMLY